MTVHQGERLDETPPELFINTTSSILILFR
jgi:hypothetical protein